jgi:hypothetical protein
MDTFHASDGVVCRELDGEAVLLNLDSGMYFGLDRIGTRIWQLVEEHGQLDAIVAALGEEYDAGPETLRQDVSDLLSALAARGLIVPREDGIARA